MLKEEAQKLKLSIEKERVKLHKLYHSGKLKSSDYHKRKSLRKKLDKVREEIRRLS